jgi:hypothetical protein
LKQIFLPKDDALTETIYWIGWTFLLALITYLLRTLVNFTSWRTGPTSNPALGILIVIALPFLCLIVGVLCIITFWVLRKSLTVKHPAPIMVYLLGMIIAIVLPLPSLPPLPEETHFSTYRTDYEEVVEMARSRQLEHGNCQGGYELPSNYQHLSETGCITVYDLQGLVVEFLPLSEFYTRVIYFEVSADAATCRNRGYLRKRIDEHWYICQHD